MAARRATCMGSFQFRRTSFAPPSSSTEALQKRNLRRATTQPVDTVWDVDENKLIPATPPPLSAPTPSGVVEPVQPKRKKRKKKAPVLDLKMDPSLSEEKRLMIAIERSLKLEYETKYAKASASEREEFEESTLRVMDHLQTQAEANAETLENHQNAGKYKPNPANEELAKREAQLKAIVASYKKDLAHWEAVQGSAEQDEISAVELPEAPQLADSETVRNVDEVLASSTRAVESFILQTDHIRAVLKQLESRNRVTKTRVRDIAVKLNDRLIAEFFGNADQNELIPPGELAAVQTNDLVTSDA